MTRRFILFFLLIAFRATAQSTEPQILQTRTITGAGDGRTSDYVFIAGPGQVLATAEATITADAEDARLSVELLDGSAASLASALLGDAVDRTRDRVEETLRRTVADLLSGIAQPPPLRKRRQVRLQLEQAQTLTMRVRAGKGVAKYAVRLEGPVELSPANEQILLEPEDAGASERDANPGELSATSEDATSVETQTGEEADATQADESAQDATVEEAAVEAPPVRPIRIPGRKRAEDETPAAGDAPGDGPAVEAPPVKPIRIPGRKPPATSTKPSAAKKSPTPKKVLIPVRRNLERSML